MTGSEASAARGITTPHRTGGRQRIQRIFSLGNKMPRLVSIHAESNGVTGVFEMRPVLEGSGAGRGPMSAATAGSVCLSEKRLLFSALVVDSAASLF